MLCVLLGLAPEKKSQKRRFLGLRDFVRLKKNFLKILIVLFLEGAHKTVLNCSFHCHNPGNNIFKVQQIVAIEIPSAI